MVKRLLALLILLCFSINISFGTVVTIIEKDISYSFTKTPGNKVTVESKTEEIKGWNVKSGGVTLDLGYSFIMPENDVTIEAIYASSNEFLLTVEMFGELTREIKNVGDEITVSVVPNDNCVFIEWLVTGITLTSEQLVSPSITFTMPNNAVSIVTKYNQLYTISYDANGGVGEPSSQIKTQGTALTLSSTIPTKEGYDFLGWSTDNLATTAEYEAGANFVTDANIVLYAVWQAKEYLLTVEFPDFTETFNKKLGESITLEAVSENEDYVFGNWTATGVTLTTQQQENTILTFTMPANAVTLVANYTDVTIATYTISYNANGGSGEPASQTKTQGVDLTLSSIEPTKEGYNFLGWSTSSSATSAEYTAGGNFTVDEDTILYAVWG